MKTKHVKGMSVKKNIGLSIILMAAVALFFVLSGCSSGTLKKKREERDRLVQTSKLTCDFVNAEIHPDIEVELNLQMAKRCDPEKPMTMTQFKTPSENQGIMYCCSLSGKEQKAEAPASRGAKKDNKNDKNDELDNL
jgi:hypothetical protein